MLVDLTSTSVFLTFRELELASHKRQGLLSNQGRILLIYLSLSATIIYVNVMKCFNIQVIRNARLPHNLVSKSVQSCIANDEAA